MDIKELEKEIEALDKRIALKGDAPLSSEDVALLMRAKIMEIRAILQRLMEF